MHQQFFFPGYEPTVSHTGKSNRSVYLMALFSSTAQDNLSMNRNRITPQVVQVIYYDQNRAFSRSNRFKSLPKVTK